MARSVLDFRTQGEVQFRVRFNSKLPPKVQITEPCIRDPGPRSYVCMCKYIYICTYLYVYIYIDMHISHSSPQNSKLFDPEGVGLRYGI